MPEAVYRCPHCWTEFGAAAGLGAHLCSHPTCRAHASLAQSLARVGVQLCPRCRMGIVGAAHAQWTADGFVHPDCLTLDERADRIEVDTTTAQHHR